jgi:thioredoxin 1|tara:strand:+ start:330 stop:596 length:267 start_codon:yes stop_codon:yes gene_type:complete
MEIQQKGTVLIQFSADWCGPCKAMKSIVEQFQEKSKVTFQKVNVDTENIIAQEYGVRSIPCFIVLKNGKQTERKVGTQSLDQLLELVK